jgi:class 3 adenylate cyclase
MALTAITRYKLRKLLKYMLVTTGVAWVLTLFSGDAVRGWLGAWALLGLWTGVLEEFLFGRRFRSLAIPLQFLGKVLAVNVLTIAFVLLAFAFDREQNLPLMREGSFSAAEMLAMAQFYRLILRVVVVTSIAILVVQLEELMGRRMFLGFLLGRYERPQAQERIVLSMDLVGSTALAERLGDLRYFRFLNTTYSLMTDALLRNEGEVHKYVGDEVIITWTMMDGLREHNCLDLFFDVQERIAAHADELQREYGAVPQFRGAVHGGRVIVAQIGHIKRGIELSGDVMNATSRMVGVCKEMKADLLVSAELLGRIPQAEERFRLGRLQVAPVKGRRREVRVHAVERVKRPGRS